MSLGLSHSLSRHKLKFSPDKVDTMIIQAIALLDDLDKELNTYAMRVKEWYGWHFPEMARIVNDNLAYARIILAMGMRTNAANADLAEILPEEIETAVKAAAEISMGTEITNEDLENIRGLAEQVVSFTDERTQLSSYLSARMAAVAPNLTALVGDLVGARLIAHAGSLMNLAKSPASTIQILGAEKALFRALKTKHDTPKYGLIYHASLIGQATGKNKGKIARMLSTKAALGLRVDALADWSAEGEGKGDGVTDEERSAMGLENRLKVERRLAGLEGKPLRSRGVAIAPNGVSMQPGKWEVKEARKYNPDADGLAGDEPAAIAATKMKSKSDKPEGLKQLIQEVKEDTKPAESEDSDSESDVEMEDDEPSSRKSTKPSERRPEATTNGAPEREASASDSPSSPEPGTVNQQPSIMPDMKEAKKARKLERRERKAGLSDEKAQKRKEKAERKEKKQKKSKQQEQRKEDAKNEADDMEALAQQAGLSLTRYKRKLERGEISFDAEGRPTAISKKDIKKVKKRAEKMGVNGDGVEETGKKRKRGGEDAVGGKEERRKKRKERG